jgi:glycosyltransferase involved in cell wall biosynthesis
MKALFVDQYSQPGGAQLCLREVMDAARVRGWQSWLMVPGDGLPASIAGYASGRKRARDVGAFGFDTIRAAIAMRRRIREQRIDVLYANGPRVLAAAALTGTPLVFHVHSYLAQGSARAIAYLSLRFGRVRILAASKFVASPLIRMRCGPVQVIYNGITEQTFRPRSFASPAITIGIVGRIAREKGHIDFMLAAHEVAAAYPQTRFVVYGSGLFSGTAYEEEVHRAACGMNVEFRGWTDNIGEALHQIDVLAVPSAPVDSLPRVIPEALSAGTPVVAYPSGGIPELMRSRYNCLLTQSGDAGALSGAICELIGDRNLMRWLAVNGRIDWERRFQLARFQRQVCDAVEEFVKEIASGARSLDSLEPPRTASGESPEASKVIRTTAG